MPTNGCGAWTPAWRALRAALGASLLAVLALLGACGPGVGGTGTGVAPNALDAFGANAASVCGGELATLLSCASVGAAVPPAPAAAPVFLADQADDALVLVTLQGDTIELEAPCSSLRFVGQWGAVAGQAGRYYGYVAPDAAPVAATLDVQAAGAGVQLTLSRADGLVLLGPVTVVPAPGATRRCN